MTPIPARNKYLDAILRYFPLALAGVVAVEQTIKEAPGTTKKAVVMASIQAAAKVAEQSDESHVQTVGALIDGIVDAFNRSGFFTPKASTPAA